MHSRACWSLRFNALSRRVSPAVVPWMQYTDSWTPASTTSSGPALGLDRDHCWKVDQRLCKAYWTFAVVMIPSQVSFTAPLCN